MITNIASDTDYTLYQLNPPIIVGAELGKVIECVAFQNKALPIKVDNRYKDGNIRIVNSVVRGNDNTVKIGRLEP